MVHKLHKWETHNGYIDHPICIFHNPRLMLFIDFEQKREESDSNVELTNTLKEWLAIYSSATIVGICSRIC